jgi:hypothetical protein
MSDAPIADSRVKTCQQCGSQFNRKRDLSHADWDSQKDYRRNDPRSPKVYSRAKQRVLAVGIGNLRKRIWRTGRWGAAGARSSLCL